MNSNFHGPFHLFCAGCSMDDEALTAASWAGYYSARNDNANAMVWQARARELQGKVLTRASLFGHRKGDLVLRSSGEEPAVEDLEFLIDTLQIYHRALVRDAAKKGVTEAADPATLNAESK